MTAAPKVMCVERAKILALYLLAVLVAASIGMLLGTNPAHAKTFRVNSMEDAGDNSSTDGECATDPFPVGTEPNCTLRAAIGETNFNGESDTITFDPALSGPITLTLGELTIANDTPANDDLSIQGPGVRAITVSANDASRVFLIHQGTEVTISGLMISDGSPNGSGGGGGIWNSGTLELANTTVSDNTAARGGGIVNNSGAELQLINTTVSGNTASFVHGGGGIYNDNGTVTLENTTMSGNIATSSSTSNSGGIHNNNGTVNLTNTIIARNTANTSPDASGTFTSQGNNLIGNTTGATGFIASDLKNVNPLLGSLQDNGGPTFTHVLLPGSPAVDAGRNAACTFEDQRGVARKDGDRNGTVICDIGAFERNDLTPPKVTTTEPDDGKTGVVRNTDLSANFSERMSRASLSTSTFKLFRVNANGSTTQISDVAVSSTTNGLKATLNPDSRLTANTRYKAVVTTAAKDRAGNRLDQNRNQPNNQSMEWFFTTGTS